MLVKPVTCVAHFLRALVLSYLTLEFLFLLRYYTDSTTVALLDALESFQRGEKHASLTETIGRVYKDIGVYLSPIWSYSYQKNHLSDELFTSSNPRSKGRKAFREFGGSGHALSAWPSHVSPKDFCPAIPYGPVALSSPPTGFKKKLLGYSSIASGKRAASKIYTKNAQGQYILTSSRSISSPTHAWQWQASKQAANNVIRRENSFLNMISSSLVRTRAITTAIQTSKKVLNAGSDRFDSLFLTFARFSQRIGSFLRKFANSKSLVKREQFYFPLLSYNTRLPTHGSARFNQRKRKRQAKRRGSALSWVDPLESPIEIRSTQQFVEEAQEVKEKATRKRYTFVLLSEGNSMDGKRRFHRRAALTRKESSPYYEKKPRRRTFVRRELNEGAIRPMSVVDTRGSMQPPHRTIIPSPQDVQSILTQEQKCPRYMPYTMDEPASRSAFEYYLGSEANTCPAVDLSNPHRFQEKKKRSVCIYRDNHKVLQKRLTSTHPEDLSKSLIVRHSGSKLSLSPYVYRRDFIARSFSRKNVFVKLKKCPVSCAYCPEGFMRSMSPMNRLFALRSMRILRGRPASAYLAQKREKMPFGRSTRHHPHTRPTRMRDKINLGLGHNHDKDRAPVITKPEFRILVETGFLPTLSALLRPDTPLSYPYRLPPVSSSVLPKSCPVPRWGSLDLLSSFVPGTDRIVADLLPLSERRFRVRENAEEESHGSKHLKKVEQTRLHKRKMQARKTLIPGAVAQPAEAINRYPGEKLVFWDDFDTLDFDKRWKPEITMGGFGNWEFQLYWNNRSNIFTQDGILNIRPTLIDWLSPSQILDGTTLDIFGTDPASLCTSHQNWGCIRSSNAAEGIILNPVASGRLRSAETFSFKYGRMEVRAKLPKGDWLRPGIRLLPRTQVYGPWPASGEIDMVESRGNAPGSPGGGYDTIHSTLHVGPFPDANMNDLFTESYKGASNPGSTFADAFRIYGLKWSPSGIIVYLDREDNVILNRQWDVNMFDREEHDKTVFNPWTSSTNPKAAPFDQEFYIVLHLAVGGTNGVFPDSPQKPWVDTDPAAMASFWKNRDQWIRTWDPVTTTFQIDYIRVWQDEYHEDGSTHSGEFVRQTKAAYGIAEQQQRRKQEGDSLALSSVSKVRPGEDPTGALETYYSNKCQDLILQRVKLALSMNVTKVV